MKYSKNAITQLKKQYKSVLLKCALINAALFMIAAPAMAVDSEDLTTGQTGSDTQIEFGQSSEPALIPNPGMKTEPESEVAYIDPDPSTPIRPMPLPEIVEQSEMSKAWLEEGKMKSPAGLELQKMLINMDFPGARNKFDDALSALAPNNAPVTQAVALAVMERIYGGVGTQLSKPSSGLASGDALNGVSAWGGAYYGSAKLDDLAGGVYGFDVDSKGVTAGVDKKVTSSIKLGLGAQYDKSDVNAFKRDVAVDTTAVFGYGEYRPSNWYISGIAAYGRSDYDEKKFVSEKTVKAHYKADLFAAQALTGYDFVTHYADVSPNAGLRYSYIKRHGYNDGANQDISGSNSDILTGVAGLKVAKSFGGFRPSAYVNFTYDMIADRDNATVRLTNGANYSVNGKRLNKFGTEAGAALEYNYNAWGVAASYDYAGRRHFNSHTGMLTAKYSF